MNIEPLKTFLEEEIQPHQLATLLDDMLFEYIETIVIQQLLENNERGLHRNLPTQMHIIRRLRDVLAECTSA